MAARAFLRETCTLVQDTPRVLRFREHVEGERERESARARGARKAAALRAPKPEPPSLVSVMPPTEAISQLYSQSSARGRGLVVSERLWFACVLNGSSLDFFDLAATTPQPDVACAFKFLCSERLTGDAPATEAVLSPHDASILAVGTASGTLAFLRLHRTAASSGSPSSVLAMGNGLEEDLAQGRGPLLVHKVLEQRPSARAQGARDEPCATNFPP